MKSRPGAPKPRDAGCPPLPLQREPISISIAPIAIEHVEGFHACLDAVAREKTYLAQIEAPPLARVRAFVEDSLRDDAAQFVALDDARLVGWCDIFPGWAHAVRHRGTLGMGVRSDYRGRGIGTALLGACIAKATARGVTRIELEVRVDNAPAIRLYERAGFVVEARKRYALRLDDVYHDAWLMSRIDPATT